MRAGAPVIAGGPAAGTAGPGEEAASGAVWSETRSVQHRHFVILLTNGIGWALPRTLDNGLAFL